MISARTGGVAGFSGIGASLTAGIVGIATTISPAFGSPPAPDLPASIALAPAYLLAQIPTTSAQPVPALPVYQWLTLIPLISAPLVLILLWTANIIRPGSLSQSRRSVKEHPAWVWLAAAALIWVSLAVGASVAVEFLGGIEKVKDSPRGTSLMSAAAYAFALGVCILLVRLLRPSGGFTFRLKDLPLGLLCLLAVYPLLDLTSRVATLVETWRTGSAPSALAHETLQQLSRGPLDGWAWLTIGLAVIAAPVVEEVTYRGCLQGGLLRLTGRPWPSILIAALIFAATHAAVASPHALPALFVLGVGLGVAVERTGSLGVSIVAHGLFNALNIALMLALR